MKLEEIIEAAATTRPKQAVVEEYCQNKGLTFHQFADQFAKKMVENYEAGIYSWDLCDLAINNLWGYAVAKHNGSFPKYADGVYCAFDEAEYDRPELPPDFNYETITKALLADLKK